MGGSHQNIQLNHSTHENDDNQKFMFKQRNENNKNIESFVTTTLKSLYNTSAKYPTTSTMKILARGKILDNRKKSVWEILIKFSQMRERGFQALNSW